LLRFGAIIAYRLLDAERPPNPVADMSSDAPPIRSPWKIQTFTPTVP